MLGGSWRVEHRDLVAHADDDTLVARRPSLVEVAPCGGWRRWGETEESRLASARALTLDMPASPSVQQEVKHGRTKPAGVAHPCPVKLSFGRLPALDGASSLRTYVVISFLLETTTFMNHVGPALK